MRLRTKLVLAATALTTAIVLVLSTLFVGELLRQRIEQTASSNEVLAHEVLLMTRQAVESGLREAPPRVPTEEGLRQAVAEALENNASLIDVMQAIVRYSPTVEDVAVTDASGRVLVSTDPDARGQQLATREDLLLVRDESLLRQTRQVFGRPRVLDLSEPLERNGQPFLLVHVGVRSTFVRASYEPWLRAAFLFALLAAVGAMIASGVLATAALRPIEQISQRLEELTAGERERQRRLPGEMPEPVEAPRDAVVRVTQTINRLGEQIRTTEAGYTALRANVNQMLETLRDGVLLFGTDGRAAMVSEAAALLLGKRQGGLVGCGMEEIFGRGTALGDAVLWAFENGGAGSAEQVHMEDGREVQVTTDRIGGEDGQEMGTLVRLRDMESAAQLEKELEVSRRLAAVGRLTAGVGHEVKNPINAMVVHLELLKSKLRTLERETGAAAATGAQRHVDILAGEMKRLDRVVETLADFSRPMELRLQERSVQSVMDAVVELTEAEMDENGVRVLVEAPREPVLVRMDPELMRQALLNLVLNGMQAMPDGGLLLIRLRRNTEAVLLEVQDAGHGIPSDILPRIFDLYFTTKAKGSGIGLAMTYRIVQMHGGALDVSSRTSDGAMEAGAVQGTTFTIRLPTRGLDEGRKLARMSAAGAAQRGGGGVSGPARATGLPEPTGGGSL